MVNCNFCSRKYTSIRYWSRHIKTHTSRTKLANTAAVSTDTDTANNPKQASNDCDLNPESSATLSEVNIGADFTPVAKSSSSDSSFVDQRRKYFPSSNT